MGESLGAADVSHNGKQLVYFRLDENKVELVTSDLDGLNEHVVVQLPPVSRYLHPRWSPDDQTIAYQHSLAFWEFSVFTISVAGGTPKQVTREDDLMNGLAWTPDGREIIYSSGRGASIIYLPTMQLWAVPRDGGSSRVITTARLVTSGPTSAGMGLWWRAPGRCISTSGNSPWARIP